MAEVVSTQGGLIFSMLMGDFNSTPGSAVYRFVRHGELDCGAEDRRNMAGQLEGAGQGWPPRHLRKVGLSAVSPSSPPWQSWPSTAP